jgi:S-adenosylmethionine:diacylglycerol 3-amino-3-carboxypropyl transferase
MRGRPKLPEGERKEYQRIAVHKSTYEKIVKRAKKEDVDILILLDRLVDGQ